MAIEMLIKVGEIDKKIHEQLSHTFAIASAKHPHLDVSILLDLEVKYGYKPYMDKLIDLFDRNFNEEEIETIKKFWSSPVGRRLNTGSFSKGERDLSEDWISGLQLEITNKYPKPKASNDNNPSEQIQSK